MFSIESPPLEDLPKTRSTTCARLRKKGVYTYWDLLLQRPTRYDDYRHRLSLTDFAETGKKGTIQGKVTHAKWVRTRSRLTIQQFSVQMNDEADQIICSFFNQPHLLSQVKAGDTVSVSGQTVGGGKPQLTPIAIELSMPGTKHIHTGCLVASYSESLGVSSKTLREKIFYLVYSWLPQARPEIHPEAFRTQHGLLSLTQAVTELHFPQSPQMLQRAIDRLSFDELFLLTLDNKAKKKRLGASSGAPALTLSTEQEKRYSRFVAHLPFALTADQSQAIATIRSDLQRSTPMNRFLQGDVGSGKTIVALLATLHTVLAGRRVYLMAPTEILAEQHMHTFSRYLSPLSITVGLITGSRPRKTHQADITIGTHALIFPSKQDDSIALTIIDEQHRFGVMQRSALRAVSVTSPHVLTMTATPIPRTIALTVFGDLDVSVISHSPQGRKHIKTFLVPPHKRNDAYNWIERRYRESGEQCFVICPLVEDAQSETLSSVRSAVAEHKRISALLPTLSVGLIHGRMKQPEKEKVMSEFAQGKLHILVATSLVEVGIDIPNATTIVIEGAERFGLSQLHQLRGRVGRSDKQSYCFLFTTADTSNTERLDIFTRTHSGLMLAEEDLRIRGAGNIWGTQQHGFINLRFADLSNLDRVVRISRAAENILEASSHTHGYDQYLPHSENSTVTIAND